MRQGRAPPAGSICDAICVRSVKSLTGLGVGVRPGHIWPMTGTVTNSGVNKNRAWVASALLVIVSALLGYAAMEVGYRLYQYSTIAKSLLVNVRAQLPGPAAERSVFDRYTGYRYKSNFAFRSETSPFPIDWRTNSHGLIAREEFSVQKPAREFRIGLIGDSFTANVTNTVRWGDVLEDVLNASPEWRDRIGGRNTRVINFGLDGIGVVQFGEVAERIAQPFGIDLLLVNVIRGDVMRRPIYRGSRAAVAEPDLAEWIKVNALSKMPWLSPYPEVLAVTMGRFTGLEPRLTIERAGNLLMGDRRFYDTAEEAAAQSSIAARLVERRFPDAIWLLHPTWDEYTNQPNPSGNDKLEHDSFRLFRNLVSDIEFVNMRERVPMPNSRAEIDSWFNVPHDRHNSDLGLRIYGQAVARFVVERWTKRSSN